MKKLLTITALFVIMFTGCSSGGSRERENISSDELVDRIVNSDIPVVVDFWAVWCTPCRMLEPVLHDVRREYEGRVRFVRVDIEAHRGIAAYFRVNSLPTVFMIEDNTVRAAIGGVRERQVYVDAIENLLKMAAAR